MKIPSQPAAIAARASTGASTPSPDVVSPAPPGRCTECVASKITAITRLANPIKRTHVRDEIVVAEGRARAR